jgi:hypothetical protein
VRKFSVLPNAHPKHGRKLAAIFPTRFLAVKHFGTLSVVSFKISLDDRILESSQNHHIRRGFQNLPFHLPALKELWVGVKKDPLSANARKIAMTSSQDQKAALITLTLLMGTYCKLTSFTLEKITMDDGMSEGFLVRHGGALLTLNLHGGHLFDQRQESQRINTTLARLIEKNANARYLIMFTLPGSFHDIHDTAVRCGASRSLGGSLLETIEQFVCR